RGPGRFPDLAGFRIWPVSGSGRFPDLAGFRIWPVSGAARVGAWPGGVAARKGRTMRASLAAPDGSGGVRDLPDLRLPKYYRVKRQLLDLTGVLPAGAAVPPERELAQRYGTSRTTVRQALAELAVEGKLLRVQGRGTFVAKPKGGP